MDVYLTQPVAPFHAAALVSSNFTTKQNVAPSPLAIIQANALRPESKITMKAWGDYSTTGTPNLTLGFWHGTQAGAISGDIALSSVIATATATAWPWWMEWEGICTNTGTAGSLLGQGALQLGSALTTFNAEVPIPITAALRTVTFDTTIPRAIGVSATWGTASASNIVTVNGFRAIIWN